MTTEHPGVSDRHFAAGLAGIIAVALALRALYPTADPPWNPTVGIVWHDEGAWVHNARNRALFGAWVLDAWNPMYIAPVFTGLEYVSFAAFGVGVRQARLVSEFTGLMSVLFLALGIRQIAGREAGLIAGALIATNYVYVMYNRAAIMEGTMVAFMVAAWYCYVRAQTTPQWGWIAAACALMAYFTKASAAFFVAAVALEALLAILRPTAADSPASRAAARATLTGLIVCGLLALAVFVVPNWAAYLFYNWQMSVTRKPNYDPKSVLDRVSWFPVLHDIFTRTWFVLALASAAALGGLARWRRALPAERLLLLWLGLGALELMMHDVGNERRFVFFIPALVALASLVLGRDRALLPIEVAGMSRRRALVALPLVLLASYIVFASITRLAFLYEVRPNVRLAAALAVIFSGLVYATWPRVVMWLAHGKWTPRAGIALALVVCCGSLAEYLQWAAGRTYKNYLASVELGKRLPPGTAVHGKLANGLALENRIRPIFVGRGFGNYDDRRTRDDVRYILTYVAPRVGYEGQVIEDVLDAYPNRSIIMTFDVAETATGHDRAALIDKFGGRADGASDGTRRARN